MIPVIEQHDGILVVRDDLYPGGTKARYAGQLFDGVEEIVYASPCEGGAQVALAAEGARLGKRATIFCAKRAMPHRRTMQARHLGAKVVQVSPGYLSVVQARARRYCELTGARLAPFGFDWPACIDAIATAARSISIRPAEVWCAAGSGVLARGLAAAWPMARLHAVQVGRALRRADVAGAAIHIAPWPFAKAVDGVPFPACPHYDAKAWLECRRARHIAEPVVFWNVLGT